MKQRLLPVLLLVAMYSLAMTGIARGAESPLQTTSKGPIHITSDRLVAYDDKALVLFSGSVVATQDGAVMHADELYLYYDKKNDGKNVTPGVTMSAGKIQRIELKGNVRVEQGNRTATGDRAVFYNADQRIVMTGNPVMREGDNVITGDKITVFLMENRGIVESSGDEKRVTATIYPEDDSLKKDKNEKSQDQAN